MATAPRARHRAEPPARSRRVTPLRRSRTGRSLGAPLLLTLVLTVCSMALTTPSDAAGQAGTTGRVPALSESTTGR